MPNPTERVTDLPIENRAFTTRKTNNHRNPYQHLVDHFPDILYRYRLDTPQGFEFINPAITAMTGQTPVEFLDDPSLIFARVLPEDRHLLEDCLVRLNCTGPIIIRWLRKNGVLVWTEHRSIPVIDTNGKTVAIEGVIRDVTKELTEADRIPPKYAIVPHLIALGKALEKPSSLYELAEIIGVAVKQLSEADAGLLLKLSANNQVLCLWADGLEDNRIKVTAQQVYLALKDRPSTSSNLVFIADPQDESEKYQSMILCPLIFENRLLGGLACFHARPRTWPQQDLDAIEAFARQAAVVLENVQLGRELQDNYLQTILALTKTMRVRDVYTADHSHQLVGWAETVAWKLGCRSRDIESIRWAALLHDIGKLGVPDMVLGKPSKLTDDEWIVMKRHPQIGAEIVGVIQQMGKVSRLIKHHHEHYDGSGYPDGLNGDEIPLGARILAVVDAYSAMTSDRVYRPARQPGEARDELQRTAGSQFDPKVVSTFLQILNNNTDAIQPMALTF